MNRGPVIFIGVLVAMCCSWYGFIFRNFQELGHANPVIIEGAGRIYPGRSGAAQRGQEIYRANNCAACHTMQVRVDNVIPHEVKKIPGTVDKNFDYAGLDLSRGWGTRPTVLQDFTFDQHLFLGTARLGPDLANVGIRHASADWHLRHLYDPKLMVPGSTMPPYPFLFEKRKIGPLPSHGAMAVPGIEAGYEVVPTEEATALAAYLQSLRSDVSIFPAPLPQLTTNTVEGADSAATAPAGTAPQK